DGRRKLAALASELPIIALFDSAELSAALGVEGVVHAGVGAGGEGGVGGVGHAGVAAGGMAERLLREFERFQGMQANGSAEQSRTEICVERTTSNESEVKKPLSLSAGNLA